MSLVVFGREIRTSLVGFGREMHHERSAHLECSCLLEDQMSLQ